MNQPLIPAQPVEGLVRFFNERDVLQDLFTYLAYIHSHSVKRMVRTNLIPKSDSVRIARLLEDVDLEDEVKDFGSAGWIEFLDTLALDLSLVSYDVTGEYVGYSSTSPSFIDNYIVPNRSAFEDFLNLEPVQQKRMILQRLIDPPQWERTSGSNEFFVRDEFSRLDRFSTFGSAIGVMPFLRFDQAREFLFSILEAAEPNTWYDVDALVSYLKANHPYFLIPRELPPDRWGKVVNRYDNFHEGEHDYDHRSRVSESDPDAFERVEGRYVERFLEGIPLTMGFIEVAYDPNPSVKIKPMVRVLKAFQVNEHFIRVRKGSVAPPRVTVQPNFEVIVESECYPAKLVQTLAPLGVLTDMSKGMSHAAILNIRLRKESVAAELVRNPNLDVVALLEQLAGRELPANVVTEIQEWGDHAEQFTLYTGFTLLETAEPVNIPQKHLVNRISDRFSLVRQPEKLVDEFDQHSLAPVLVDHFIDIFRRIDERAETIFPKNEPEAVSKPATPETTVLHRSISYTIHFNKQEMYEDFRMALAETRCPFQFDPVKMTITYLQADQEKFDQAAQSLADRYDIRIEEKKVKP